MFVMVSAGKMVNNKVMCVHLLNIIQLLNTISFLLKYFNFTYMNNLLSNIKKNRIFYKTFDTNVIKMNVHSVILLQNEKSI